MLIEVLLGGLGSISSKIDNLFEHNVEAAVHKEADIAAAWVRAHVVAFGVRGLTEWYVDLVRVPFSESEDFVIILHLLGNDCGVPALVILKGNPHLADVFSHLRVVNRGRYEVVASKFELRPN